VKVLLAVLALLVVVWVVAMVIGLFGRLILWVSKPGWSTFTDAWGSVVAGEKSLRNMSGKRVRSASEISYEERVAMEQLYNQWRALGRGRPKAKEWLKQVVADLSRPPY